MSDNDQTRRAPFTSAQVPVRRSWWDRLAFRTRPEWAQQVIENLLATTGPDTTTRQEIEQVYREFRVSSEQQSNIAWNLCSKAVQHFLAEGTLGTEQWKYLDAVFRLVDLGAVARRRLDCELLHPMFLEGAKAILSARFEEEDAETARRTIDELALRLSISAADQATIRPKAAHGFLQEKLGALEAVRRLSQAQHSYICDIASAFHVGFDDVYRGRLLAYLDAWSFETGHRRPTCKVDINLQPGESCLYVAEGNWRTTRTSDAGRLFVTTARLLWQGEERNTAIPYKGVLSLAANGQTVEIRKASGPVINVATEGPEYADVILLAAKRAMSGQWNDAPKQGRKAPTPKAPRDKLNTKEKSVARPQVSSSRTTEEEVLLRKHIFALSRQEVESGDIDRLLTGLARHVASCGGADKTEGCIAFQLDGWSEDPRGLWEIDEVRDYFAAIHKKFPVFPFFLMNSEIPAAGLYFRILARPEPNSEGLERTARYLNESVRAICAYAIEFSRGTGRQIDAVLACQRLSRAVGFDVSEEELRKELGEAGARIGPS